MPHTLSAYLCILFLSSWQGVSGLSAHQPYELRGGAQGEDVGRQATVVGDLVVARLGEALLHCSWLRFELLTNVKCVQLHIMS